MKSALPIATALLAANVVFLVADIRPATAEPCAGPFRQCAYEVQATCSRDADGRQRMTYWDQGGYTITFERCVGRIFEAAGRPNPYKTGIATSGNLTVPWSEVLYPMAPNR